jgi:hypothetical protein
MMSERRWRMGVEGRKNGKERGTDVTMLHEIRR